MALDLGKFNPFFLIATFYFFTLMQTRFTLPLFLFLVFCFDSQAQIFRLRKKVNEEDVERRVGIARIKIEARPPKGTAIADVANFPEFFGERSNLVRYQKQNLISKLPPTTGDSLREVTSDSLALFLLQNLYDWDVSGDNRQEVRRKKNSIHDLPNEDYQKFLNDSTLDEAVDISCFWVFTEMKDQKLFKPEIQMKATFFDKKGASRPPLEVVMEPNEIQCAHFNETYGNSYDFNKGIPLNAVEEGGIAGNVVVDVYLQALKKLLAKK
jgi:hypothetical protein